MPKKTYIIQRFDGGLNDDADKRDIFENELASATNVMVDKYGRLRNMGSIVVNSPAVADHASSITNGYGLFAFTSDYSFLSTIALTGSISGTVNTVGDTITGATSGATATLLKNYSNTLYVANQLGTFQSETINFTTGSGTATVGGDTVRPTATETKIWVTSNGNLFNFYDTSTSGTVGWFQSANTKIIDLGTNTSSVKPVYYSDNNILRIFDGNHTHTGNTAKYFGYIPARTRWANGLTGGNGWYFDDAEIAAPAAAVAEKFTLDGTINATGDFADADGEIAIDLTKEGSGSSGLWAGSYKCGISFVYDDGQESDLTIFSQTVTPDTDDRYHLALLIRSTSYTAGGKIPMRVTHVRVYLQQVDKGDSWWYQGQVKLGGASYLDGGAIKSGFSINHLGQRLGSSGEYYYYYFRDNATDQWTTSPSTIATYKSNTGRNVGDSTTASFKSVVIANRQAYVGNTIIGGIVNGDRMIKSPVNQLDIFQETRAVDAVVSDADEIVHIEEYADRILQFKKRAMYVINVSREFEFLENRYPNKGCSNPYAVTKTDKGVAWVNEHGCYLYNGERVDDLLDKKGFRKISQTTWSSFIDTDSIIGYVPSKKQLIITKSGASGNDHDVYMYDMITSSWTFGKNKIPTTDLPKSNFVVDWDGNLQILYDHDDNDSSRLYKWSDSSANASTYEVMTKDIDFGDPSRRKKIYKVIMSYKSGASVPAIHFRTNNGTTNYNFNTTISTNQSTTAITEFKPATAAQANNVKSFQIVLSSSGTVSSAFEINDISIIYRGKSIK